MFKLSTFDFNIKEIKKLSFRHKLRFLIPLAFQPDGLNLRYVKFRIFDPTEMIL